MADDLYAIAERLVRLLRQAGLAADADRVSHVLHDVAWTTSSELIGALGQTLLGIEDRHGRELPADIARQLGSAIAAARKVWPDLKGPAGAT